jgi:hypothetical protein
MMMRLSKRNPLSATRQRQDVRDADDNMLSTLGDRQLTFDGGWTFHVRGALEASCGMIRDGRTGHPEFAGLFATSAPVSPMAS